MQRNAKVHSGETYNYILGQPESAARLNSVPQEPEDTWNQQRNSYNDQNASAGAQYSGSDDANAPGVADLGAYGTYSDQPGYGEVWQPNDVGPDWDPYDNGAWSYYPDWGWTFVSAYPWGWAPFYYGNWCYIGGRGWWWHPGPWHGTAPATVSIRDLSSPSHPAGNWSAPHPPAHVSPRNRSRRGLASFGRTHRPNPRPGCDTRRGTGFVNSTGSVTSSWRMAPRRPISPMDPSCPESTA